MKRKLATLFACLMLPTLLITILFYPKFPSPALKAKYGISTPSNIKIKHYEWSGFGMDHSHVWLLEPADSLFVKALVDSAGLQPVPIDESQSGLWSDWPAWWPQNHLETLPERYYLEKRYEYWFIGVDRENDLIYVQWFDS
ncbi:MAG: hypothetical protein AAGB26_18235 [Planctomycetota bacterium]